MPRIPLPPEFKCPLNPYFTVFSKKNCSSCPRRDKNVNQKRDYSLDMGLYTEKFL